MIIWANLHICFDCREPYDLSFEFPLQLYYSAHRAKFNKKPLAVAVRANSRGCTERFNGFITDAQRAYMKTIMRHGYISGVDLEFMSQSYTE